MSPTADEKTYALHLVFALADPADHLRIQTGVDAQHVAEQLAAGRDRVFRPIALIAAKNAGDIAEVLMNTRFGRAVADADVKILSARVQLPPGVVEGEDARLIGHCLDGNVDLTSLADVVSDFKDKTNQPLLDVAVTKIMQGVALVADEVTGWTLVWKALNRSGLIDREATYEEQYEHATAMNRRYPTRESMKMPSLIMDTDSLQEQYIDARLAVLGHPKSKNDPVRSAVFMAAWLRSLADAIERRVSWADMKA